VLVEVRDLDFSYGPVQVLFDVSLEVREGEVLALLGTNGAGKSTLLRALTGLQLPSRGTVTLAGRDITDLPAEQRVRAGVVQVPGARRSSPA
jgi:ABC-type branched-subunit amino acid transport system ATPase component